jgi:predicted NBD/HSP70 family sugar kinase
VAVANLVQILNPTLVVLCNKLSRLAGDQLRECVTRAVAKQCAIPGSRPAEVRVSPPKKDISAVGCALLAAEAEAQRAVRRRLFGETE